jgi:outer membrane protein assembly factor BamB
VAAGADTVWATTGDPASSGTHLYHAYSFVRLGAQGLELRSSWQLKLGQSADLDFGSTPTMFTGTVDGKPAPLVGACNKNGLYYALRQYDPGLGPVWSVQVGASAHTDQGMCLASGVWNQAAGQLYLSGNTTTISGTQYDGSVQAVDASTGQQIWATGLPCAVLGTPSLDAATGVLAVATWAECGSGDSPAVYLVNASTGAILGTIPLPAGGEFAQPVLAGPYLLIAD